MPESILHITLPGGFTFDMMYVEGSEFLMGGNKYDDEKPIHRVKVSSFYMGKYPVTQRLWQAVMRNNPSYFKGDNRPVEQVSWEDAQNFIEKLKKETGREFRLPTEAEWEFAARGGIKSEGYEFAGSDKLKEVGWYNDNSYFETKPVGLKFPNELGIYDMSGNVWEWCQDWFESDYYKKCHEEGVVLDPQGPEGGVGRVLRGGSAFTRPLGCRSARRRDWYPDDRLNGLGFRVVVPSQSDG